MSERPAERLELAVAPVGRPGKRSRWTPVAWVAALGVVAAVAVVGQRGDDTAVTPQPVAPQPVAVAAPTAVRSAAPRVARVPPPWVTERRVAAAVGPVLGEDGLMGSLTIDLPAPPAGYRYLNWLTRFVDPTEL